jgi:hypothetical protein
MGDQSPFLDIINFGVMDVWRGGEVDRDGWYLYSTPSRNIMHQVGDFEPRNPEHEVFVQEF